MTYVDVLRECAIPDQEETRKFAEMLADAHSWYKHLLVHPPTPCILHLVPSAKGPRENPGLRRTASWAAGWPTSPAVRNGGDTGLRVSGYQVPLSLKGAGTVWLSALIRPFPEGIDSRRRSGSSLEDWLTNRFVLAVLIEEQLVPLARLPDDEMACLPSGFAEGIRGLKALWQDLTYRRESGPKERALMEPFLDAFERERTRQIGAMVEAMQRFIETAARLQS